MADEMKAPAPKSAPNADAPRWRSLALAALWVQVASLFGLVAYVLWRGNAAGGLDELVWLSAFDSFLAALVMWWWTATFARVTLGQAIPTEPLPGPDAPGSGQLRALRATFPWLTALRLSLWFLTVLGVMNESSLEANPVALTALLTVWGAAIFASNAMYGSLARLATNPAEAIDRERLLGWLNLSAALGVAMTVFNVVPIAGFSTIPTLTSQLVYGLGGVLDVVATLLAFRAVQTMPAGTATARQTAG
ncbi:hypothetical protein E7T06_19525 [Deinococcus sp. Arct2-2]|uniref:hypothetical protein n=1 Tax=Deinococcus sp. Arct2-2 TaxID=2568653 RepID=UPI0010A41265|nr:hypothetical protein [Deinococcus sp. Arct2-2]THF67774.1 hypothetical protein E7T06_19525 [Deinococcus sp. Arct2-2]